jgi:hypothetical protein
MKHILTSLFCLCIIFSSLGFAESVERQAAGSELNFVRSNTVAENSIPNIFRPIGNWFKRIFGKGRESVKEYTSPIVKNINLNQSVITAKCSSLNSPLFNSCSKNQSVEILVEVLTEGSDPNNVFSYVYKVSGGKIIGKVAKVVWNLSDVKPGIYMINAGVDDGIGVVGKGVTEEVKVVECPNCK